MEAKRNTTIIETSMEKMWKQRREMVNGNVPLKEIRKVYSFLFSELALMNDFRRLMKFDLEDRIKENKEWLSPALFNLLNLEKEKSMLTDLRALVSRSRNQKERSFFTFQWPCNKLENHFFFLRLLQLFGSKNQQT